jgi:hypothetical protein
MKERVRIIWAIVVNEEGVAAQQETQQGRQQ